MQRTALAALALAALLPHSHTQAQSSLPGPPSLPWAVASTSPQHEDDSDLKPFAEAIGNARIVALGEQTHGGREEYLLKARLLKFLHEKMGFDVLLLESGFYDMARLAERVERGEKLDDIAPGSVFFMYANSAEGRGMLQYFDRQRALGKPMALGGIDSQHTGETSKKELLPRLQAYLKTAAPALAEGEAWMRYAQAAQALLEMQRTPPPAETQAAFRRHAAALRSALCAPVPAFWCQTVKSVEAQAASYWSADHDYQRDNQMGDNAIWLADKLYPGRKVVIWAHTVHTARGFQRTPVNLQAGEVMHRHWGADYKIVQFSSAGGKILDFVTNQPLPLPAIPPDSLETALARQPHALLGLTASALPQLQLQAQQPRPQFSYEYELQRGGQLGVNWDILFFIREITPVSMAR
jgi:erythromycin esterase